MKTKLYENDKELRILLSNKFILNIPRCLEIAVQLEQSKEILEIADAMDYFEFHFRHYIAGVTQTLHRVMHETRCFKSLKNIEPDLMDAILNCVESEILCLELYELMPRFLKAKKRVIKEMKLLP
jgi:hypothetical protein